MARGQNAPARPAEARLDARDDVVRKRVDRLDIERDKASIKALTRPLSR